MRLLWLRSWVLPGSRTSYPPPHPQFYFFLIFSCGASDKGPFGNMIYDQCTSYKTQDFSRTCGLHEWLRQKELAWVLLKWANFPQCSGPNSTRKEAERKMYQYFPMWVLMDWWQDERLRGIEQGQPACRCTNCEEMPLQKTGEVEGRVVCAGLVVWAELSWGCAHWAPGLPGLLESLTWGQVCAPFTLPCLLLWAPASTTSLSLILRPSEDTKF